VELYRDAGRNAGHDPASLRVGINSHGYVADGSRQAADEAFAPTALTMDRIGRERGWPPLTRAAFDASRTLRGASFVGSPEEVAEKILFQHEIFRHDRFLVQFSVGTMPHDRIMRSIELFGTRVAPVVQRELGGSTA
jgi:alkanesulfonate monooxygenase SsuD/methylene tetrahydromethanopterin reductase-like flavin-dependent oxidoreductase (luciferase family)